MGYFKNGMASNNYTGASNKYYLANRENRNAQYLDKYCAFFDNSLFIFQLLGIQIRLGRFCK